jgi:hypothetical protein
MTTRSRPEPAASLAIQPSRLPRVIKLIPDEPRLDELPEQRGSQQIRSAYLVKAALKELFGCRGITTREPQRNSSRHRIGIVVKSAQQLLCLVKAALLHPNLCEQHRRMEPS